jgi:hypothetical protein
VPIVALGQTTGVMVAGVHGLFTLSAVVPLPGVVLDAAGEGSATLFIPQSPSLVGAAVHAQSLSLGPGGWMGISAPTSFAVL